MDQIITQIAAFFDQLGALVSTSHFAYASTAVEYGIFWLIALSGILWTFFEHAKGEQGSIPAIVGNVIRQQYKIFIVWLLVAGAPVMTSALSASIQSLLGGLNGKVASASTGIVDNLQNNLSMLMQTETVLKNQIEADHWWLATDDNQAQSSQQSAAQIYQQFQQIQQQSTAQIQGMLNQGQALISAGKIAQGQALVQQAHQAQNNIASAIQMAQLTGSMAQGAYSGKFSFLKQIVHSKSPMQTALHWTTTVMTGGISVLIDGLKRLIANGMAFVALAPALLFAIMGLWKLLQALISFFSQTALYTAVTALACAFGSALGPLALTTLLSNNPKVQEYGHRFISFWLQALAGATVLAVAIRVLVIPALGAFGVLLTSISADLAERLLIAPDFTTAFLSALTAGAPLLMFGFAADFLSQFATKAPHAGIGVVSGTFRP